MYSRKSVGPRVLRNSTIIWIFLQRIPIQNHSKLPIAEELDEIRQTSNWNLIRLELVNKARMLNPMTILGHIKCYSLNSPRPNEIPSNSIRNNWQKICSWLRRPETIPKIRKQSKFIKVINTAITSFSKILLKQKGDQHGGSFWLQLSYKHSWIQGQQTRPSNNLKNKILSDTHWRDS